MRIRHFLFMGLLFVISSVILASCGGGGGGSSTSGGSISVKGTSGNVVNMNGAWTSCSHSATDQQDEKNTITINGGSATFVGQIWDAAVTSNCTQTATPAILMNFSVTVTTGATGTAIWMNGNVSASRPAGVPANALATQATVVFNSATVTLQSAAYVSDANTNGFCGGGWTLNVPKNVLNCTQVISSTTEQDYWVIDDSAAQLKWYANDDGVAWHVDISNIMTK